MKIGCVLLNYNDANDTIDSINRISKYKTISEIIVIDNCSTQNDFQKLVNEENDKTKILKTEKNGGYGYGNNFGIKIAKNDGLSHVIIANPDTIFEESSVDEMAHKFLEDEKCGIVAPITFYRGKPCYSKLPSARNVVLESSSLYNHIFGMQTNYPADYGSKYSRYIPCEVVMGALFMVDVNKMLECLYDETIFLYCEEWVLANKMQEKGYRTYVAKFASYKHKLSQSISKSYNSIVKKRKLSNRSRLIYLKKYLHCSEGKLRLYKFLLNLNLVEAFLIDIKNRIIISK